MVEILHVTLFIVYHNLKSADKKRKGCSPFTAILQGAVWRIKIQLLCSSTLWWWPEPLRGWAYGNALIERARWCHSWWPALQAQSRVTGRSEGTKGSWMVQALSFNHLFSRGCIKPATRPTATKCWHEEGWWWVVFLTQKQPYKTSNTVMCIQLP